MPINVEHICDMCRRNIDFRYYSTEAVDVGENSQTYDIYVISQPKKIYCSMECLAKSLEWFLKRYNMEMKD